MSVENNYDCFQLPEQQLAWTYQHITEFGPSELTTDMVFLVFSIVLFVTIVLFCGQENSFIADFSCCRTIVAVMVSQGNALFHIVAINRQTSNRTTHFLEK